MKRLRIALLWIGAVPLMHAVGAADALAGEAGGAAQAPTTRLLRAAEVKPEIGYLRGTNAGGTPAPAAPTAQDLAAHRVDPGVGGAPTTQPDNASTTPPDNAQTGSGSSPGTGNDDRRVGRPLEAPVEAPAEVEAPSAGEDAAATDPSGNRERSARDGRSETGHGARNENLTVQVILQIQRGCRRYCYGVSQLQSASQLATTTQSASGATGAAGRSAAGSTLPSVGNLPPASDRQATALNRSRTIQFVWQMQIGCVAFCYGTSQSQVATQTTHSTQQAMATVTGGALAANESLVGQFLWQRQLGCRVHCYATSQSQLGSQRQTAIQTSSGRSSVAPGGEVGARVHVPLGGRRAPLLRNFLWWLRAWAANAGVTIQVIRQAQWADCRRRCVGGGQAQVATQQAETTQQASATRSAPPPGAGPTLATTGPRGARTAV